MLNQDHSYGVLLSATPDLDTGEDGNVFAAWFGKRMHQLMKQEQFDKVLPHLVNDAVSALDRIVSTHGGRDGGIFHPFFQIDRVVYLLTIRMVGCNELVESQEMLNRSLDLVTAVDMNNSTPNIIVSWLPAPKYFKRIVAAAKLYWMIGGIVNERKRTGRREEDTMQWLIDEGEGNVKIVYVSCFFESLPSTDPNSLQPYSSS